MIEIAMTLRVNDDTTNPQSVVNRTESSGLKAHAGDEIVSASLPGLGIASNYDKKDQYSMLKHPLSKRILWIAFAVLFYNSGLAFTTWLLEPDKFSGGLDWLWLTLFPVLLPAFFLVNNRLGCVGGQCQSGECRLPSEEKLLQKSRPGRMPGI